MINDLIVAATATGIVYFFGFQRGRRWEREKTQRRINERV